MTIDSGHILVTSGEISLESSPPFDFNEKTALSTFDIRQSDLNLIERRQWLINIIEIARLFINVINRLKIVGKEVDDAATHRRNIYKIWAEYNILTEYIFIIELLMETLKYVLSSNFKKKYV